MKAACDAFHRQMREQAVTILTELITYLKKEAESFETLRGEVTLVEKLRANMTR